METRSISERISAQLSSLSEAQKSSLSAFIVLLHDRDMKQTIIFLLTEFVEHAADHGWGEEVIKVTTLNALDLMTHVNDLEKSFPLKD